MLYEVITQHGEPITTETEGKPRVDLAVDSGHLQHVRVYEAAAHHLDPARLAAGPASFARAHDALHVHLRGRLP